MDKSRVMKLYSTNDSTNVVDLKEATLKSLPIDRGLYLPTSIPVLSSDFFRNYRNWSLPEIAFQVSLTLIGEDIETDSLERICYEAINFPAPLVNLKDDLSILELFHGPSLAFKDFGARFMAQLMSYFILENSTRLTILVATSGDTGGAVAAGFHGVDNIDVIILYPSGKVSPLQEKQLTTWGDNISAVEIDGSFDDCQSLVKEAFLDVELKSKYNLSSANSINIARLIPQSFYYFEAAKQAEEDRKLSISIPSGNIGNISAASLARNMGLEIDQLVAAHNSNNTVPQFYQTGQYSARKSISTISNAMDVGDPSNFSRFRILNGSTWNNIKSATLSYSISEQETKDAMREIYSRYNYLSEPHAAVAYAALQKDELVSSNYKIFLGTAHPAKFTEVVEEVLDIEVQLPESLQQLQYKEANKIQLENSYAAFQSYLLNRAFNSGHAT